MQNKHQLDIHYNPKDDKWFTVIDGYLMSEELLQRYNRIIPMRVLRAFDVIDESKIQYAVIHSYYSNICNIIETLDYWSGLWLNLYLGYCDNTSVRERNILFERIIRIHKDAILYNTL